MKNYYLNFLYAVKIYYLGNSWQQERNTEYSLHRFQQEEYSCETPQEFVTKTRA